MVLGEVITESEDDMLFWGREKPNARAPQHRQTKASWELSELVIWLVQAWHVTHFARLKKKPANSAKYVNNAKEPRPRKKKMNVDFMITSLEALW